MCAASWGCYPQSYGANISFFSLPFLSKEKEGLPPPIAYGVLSVESLAGLAYHNNWKLLEKTKLPGTRIRCPYCGKENSPEGPVGADGLIHSKCAGCGNALLIPAEYIKEAKGSTQKITGKIPDRTEKIPAESPEAERENQAYELMRDGLKLAEEKNHHAAVMKLKAAADKAPDRLDILFALAQTCSRNGLAYDALVSYKKILDADPDNREALLKTGMLYVQSKRWAAGAALLHRLMELDPGHEQGKLMLDIALTQKAEEEKKGAGAASTMAEPERTLILHEMYNLFARAGFGKNAAIAMAWAIPPVIFGVVYGYFGAEWKYIDGLLMVMFLYCVFFGVVIHELGHGFAALYCGDETALKSGRLTLNPASHASMVGTVLVPALMFAAAGVMFGWAKPVPFNPMKMRRQPRDLALVAGMGPFISVAASYLFFTLFLAVAAFHNEAHPEAYLKFSSDMGAALQVGGGSFEAFWFVALELLGLSVISNLIIGVFNLIPIPPLDGGWLIKCAVPSIGEKLNRLKWPGIAAVILLIYGGFPQVVLYPVIVALSVYYFISGAVL